LRHVRICPGRRRCCRAQGDVVITVEIDTREFTKKARQMGIFNRDQLPFAIANTLNDTMFKDTRPQIIGPTWSDAFTVRNRGLARASINVEKASKGKLSAGVFDALGKADLAVHASGGAKTHSGTLAVPVLSKVRLHARGKTPWAKELEKRFGTRAVRKTAKGLFVGKGGRLHLFFAFKGGAHLDKRFRFYEDFMRKSLFGISQRFPAHAQRAVATAFGR
jgi:hypothetical protein